MRGKAGAIGGNANAPYDVSRATYSRAWAAAYYGSHTSIAFSPNGEKLFVARNDIGNNHRIDSWSLSTPWDVGTVSLDVSNFLSDITTNIQGIALSPTGDWLVFADDANNRLIQIFMSTSWDWSSATIAATHKIDLGSPFQSPKGIFCNVANGFIFRVDSGYVVRISGDFSTPLNNNFGSTQSLSISAHVSNASGITFSTDGTRMFVSGQNSSGTPMVHRFNLSTPWDLSSAAYVSSPAPVSLASQTTLPLGLDFKPGGTRMYVSGEWAGYPGQHSVFQFDVC